MRNYLGPKFDPNSKFTVSLLWPGDRAWRQSGERRMLCGLQLPGTNNQQQAFKGKVADVDQSKVWPAGTCLGIDSATNQPIDAPVECAAPHAMEVTGTVNLAEKFAGALPAEPDQDGYIKDLCTKMTDAYLAPVKLRTTTLTLIYPTVPLPAGRPAAARSPAASARRWATAGGPPCSTAPRASCSSTVNRRCRRPTSPKSGSRCRRYRSRYRLRLRQARPALPRRSRRTISTSRGSSRW